MLNENSGYSIGYLELFSFFLESLNFFQYYGVGWEIAFPCNAIEDVSVEGVVEIEFKEITFGDWRTGS